jgi:ferrochelatase
MIVEGFVLPFRPKKSAEAYQSVWTKEGAPLKVFTENFKSALKPLIDVPVSVAMRYGNPTPETALKELMTENPNLENVLIAPLYPHYAMSSFETAYLHVLEKVRASRPKLQFKILQPFYDERAYIDALSSSVAPYLEKPYDHLLFSYHGLPVRHLNLTQPNNIVIRSTHAAMLSLQLGIFATSTRSYKLQSWWQAN